MPRKRYSRFKVPFYMNSQQYRRYRNALSEMKNILFNLDGEELLSGEEEIAKRQLISECEAFLDEEGRLEEIIEENC